MTDRRRPIRHSPPAPVRTGSPALGRHVGVFHADGDRLTILGENGAPAAPIARPDAQLLAFPSDPPRT